MTEVRKQHKFVLISGNSGAGKSSIMKSLMSNEIISFTTREMREGEEEGKDYNYITRDEFLSLRDNGHLLEWSEYRGNFYGVTLKEFQKLEESPAFCIVDFTGMKHFEEIYGKENCLSIFLYNSYSDASLQLKQRGESIDFIVKRLEGMDKEISNRCQYQYIIKNLHGHKRETTMCLYNILKAELGYDWSRKEAFKEAIDSFR